LVFEKAGISGNFSQRFLEVVGGNIGKLPEFGVGLLKLFIGFGKVPGAIGYDFFNLPARDDLAGDVDGDGEDIFCVVVTGSEGLVDEIDIDGFGSAIPGQQNWAFVGGKGFVCGIDVM